MGSGGVAVGEGLDDFDGLEAEADDLGEEADDVLGVVGVVGVAADGGALVLLDAVLVDDPFEGAAAESYAGDRSTPADGSSSASDGVISDTIAE